MSAMAECQKHIHIANQLEHCWEMVAACIGNDVTNEEDARQIKEAGKRAEQRVSKRKCKAAAATATAQCAKKMAPATQGLAQPTPFISPRPPYGQTSSSHPVGPCYHYGKVGHQKSSCPRLNKLYPFMSFGSSHSVVDS